ncbi:Predicted integral membrane protein [Jannaschia faecimaris]|uniref:Predicted integral membrane protein n=1 Tax=Jannaschia faecimaris TaxID=1244108 RepID=A0A1H3U9Q1_9RHOB|nr:Predicted integral membrane protein [Jannaschia faecimaris]
MLYDKVFTETTAIIQPIARFLLARIVGWPVSEGWVALSVLLYGFVGIFWLAVVWMQMRMRNLARAALEAGPALSKAYHGLYCWWFAFGFPAFVAVIAIVWLMLTVPNILRQSSLRP